MVLAYLRIQAHALRTLEPKVRAGESDSVHQMRVATRRLRAALRSFGQVIPATDTAHLAGPARDVALHQARKSARRARYAAEAATSAVGPQARRFAQQMKQVQSVLGDHQDAVLARHEARALGIGAHLAGENAFTYGLLYECEFRLARRRQAEASGVWKRASRPRYRRWMN